MDPKTQNIPTESDPVAECMDYCKSKLSPDQLKSLCTQLSAEAPEEAAEGDTGIESDSDLQGMLTDDLNEK